MMVEKACTAPHAHLMGLPLSVKTHIPCHAFCVVGSAIKETMQMRHLMLKFGAGLYLLSPANNTSSRPALAFHFEFGFASVWTHFWLIQMNYP